MPDLRLPFSRNSAAPSPPLNMQLPPGQNQIQWIMLCLDSKRPFVDLHQLWFFATPSNAKLFQNLLEEYKQKRQPCRFLNIPPFWRHIKAVHFVQFQTLAPEPTMTVQIEKKHSLPYNRRDWKFEGNGIQGPLMAAYMEGPDSASYGWSAYDYIPKGTLRCRRKMVVKAGDCTLRKA